MAEARIIPINADAAADQGPGERRDEPDAAQPRRRPARKRASPANGKSGKAGTSAGSVKQPKPSQPASVQPPEELRDLADFVTGKDAEQGKGRNGEASRDRPAPRPVDNGGAPTDEWERKVAGALGFLRRRLTGEYEVDEFGFDPELTSTVLAAPFRPLYERWFRVEVSGMEHVPDEGAALIVANHSGTIALDGLITALALLDHHPAHRHLRMLGADLVFKLPFIGEFARKAGNTLACQADAERLLSSGQLVGVYPEGFKGVGKPFSERYKLQRFGRGGFVSAAIKTGAPIIPCSIVGAEEIYPMLGNSKLLARLVGAPYFPLTPTFPWLGPLGMVPLPSKWYIEFGEPIETAQLGDSADDPMLVFNVADQVRETIQQTLYRLLMNRKSVFL